MDISIGEPSVLTRLPRPNTENGRSLFSQVQGLRNGVKRKRQEVCAATDGNSLNIYEVNNGRNVSSYPVPPDTIFECPPYSLRHKDENGKATRRTYTVTRRQNRRQVQCFTEKSVEVSGSPVSTIFQLPQSSTSTVHMETLHRGDNNSFMVFGKDGGFKVFDDDLSLQLASGRLDLLDDHAECMLIQCMSSVEASRSILKSRPDIIAAAGKDVIYTAAVFRKPNSKNEHPNIEYGVWAHPHSQDKHQTIQPLICQTLATPHSPLVRGVNSARFIARGSQLLLRSQSHYLIYNLSTAIPTLTETQPIFFANQVSDLAISDYLFLCTNPNSIQLFNTRFRSLQAVYEYGKSGLKRQRDSQHAGPINLIAYFPQFQRVVAVRRTSLLAIDLQSSQNSDLGSTIKQGSMLVSNIGKGVQNNENVSNISDKTKRIAVGTIRDCQFSIEEWDAVRSRLESCISEANVNSFETIFLEYASTKQSLDATKYCDQIPPQAIDYVLSKLFKYGTKVENATETSTPNLKINILAPQTIVWLAGAAYLNIERLKQALSTTHNACSLQSLNTELLTQALLDVDPSFSMFMEVLSNLPIINAGDLCAIIKVLVRRALSQSAHSAFHKAKISHDTDSNPEKSKVLTAFVDIEPSTARSLVDINNVLIAALERLAAFEHRTISANLSAVLEQQDLITLVQFLRQQLFRSGYTRSLQSQVYPSPPPSLDGISKEIESTYAVKNGLTLTSIITIISGCIDVIGPFGLISSGDEMQFIQTLVPELSSEIARVMEVLNDSTYIQGILRETLRFSESIQKDTSQEPVPSKGDSSKMVGVIRTVYAVKATDGELSSSLSTLPLSLHAEARIKNRKVCKGNGKILERSKREKGMLLDRLRPPYALERLDL